MRLAEVAILLACHVAGGPVAIQPRRIARSKDGRVWGRAPGRDRTQDRRAAADEGRGPEQSSPIGVMAMIRNRCCSDSTTPALFSPPPLRSESHVDHPNSDRATRSTDVNKRQELRPTLGVDGGLCDTSCASFRWIAGSGSRCTAIAMQAPTGVSCHGRPGTGGGCNPICVVDR